MMNIASNLKYICPTRLTSNNVKLLWPYSNALKSLFSSISHYDVLDVPKTASQEQIKKAFFEKSKKFHPDVSPDNPQHHKIFVKLNNAYSILGDKSKRKDYDQSLHPKISSYQSSEHLHRHRNDYFYNAMNPSVNYQYSTKDRAKNANVALAIIVLMSTGVVMRFMWIWYKHKQYKKELDLNSMKASKLYQESRERSSKYTMKEQLEMLAERQGKIERRRPP